VLTFLVALVHAWSVVDWFAVQGAMGDLVGEMTGSPNYAKFIGFPIKALGLTGLSIMFLLAATSHDFWLAFLTPRLWKALHMALYLAYGVLVMHVALGVMQEDRRVFIPLLLGGSFAAGTYVLTKVEYWGGTLSGTWHGTYRFSASGYEFANGSYTEQGDVIFSSVNDDQWTQRVDCPVLSGGPWQSYFFSASGNEFVLHNEAPDGPRLRTFTRVATDGGDGG
jgi:hypothetical protein